MSDPVVDHLLARQDDILRDLKTLLRMPSVSADPAFAQGMADAREFLADRLTAIGMENVQMLDGGGQPAVYGDWLHAPGKPTLLVYGHYDVQPADPLDQWTTPPFEPTERDGKLYARGASDVKGSTLIAIESAASLLSVEGKCPLNVKFFLEGEEETGSPSLRTLIERYRDLLDADAVLSADGGRASREVETINTGARGTNKLEFTLRTAAGDLHSGRYGGAVRNALHEMAALIATLHDSQGRVAVAGFDSDATPLTNQQRADTAAFPFDEAAFLAEVGALGHGDPQFSMRERITLRPCLDVNGMWGGYIGAGSKTVIPAEAHAKISIRVAAGQDPKRVLDAVIAHLKSHCPDGVELTIDRAGGDSPASTLAPDHPLVQAAERVLKGETGQRPIHVRLGASVPITSIFKETMGMDTLMFGFNLPDEPVHAPNEFFRLESIPKGLTAWPKILRELATFEPAAFKA
ncbi:dipeptidase [Thalassobaculum sp. OXR-137]|uniref:dipeptidase n=1 Tax=Thalassobaculum sp. OXR-137 TaxID=3100173 RepID=UPI002AC8F5A2|nr:dipeptidase [Thalassobaculum sp. OXR-137]WPZ36594.1 dipeptidase [Thalassobaculum sp. OXR-137]